MVSIFDFHTSLITLPKTILVFFFVFWTQKLKKNYFWKVSLDNHINVVPWYGIGRISLFESPRKHFTLQVFIIDVNVMSRVCKSVLIKLTIPHKTLPYTVPCMLHTICMVSYNFRVIIELWRDVYLFWNCKIIMSFYRYFYDECDQIFTKSFRVTWRKGCDNLSTFSNQKVHMEEPFHRQFLNSFSKPSLKM